MKIFTLPWMMLGAMLFWISPLKAQDAFTLSNALVAKENVQRFCGKLVVYSQNTNQEARPVLMALFETPENRVYDDITQSGKIPLTEYLDKVNSQLATLSFGLIPQPNRFMVASKNGKHYFVIEVDKEVNDRRVKNIFVVNAMNQKIVNIYESLSSVPLQTKPFELLADAPGQASTQTPTQPPATDPDLEAYQAARQANTAVAYQRYLSNYPNGRFRAEAQLFAGQLNATTNQTNNPASISGFSTFTETVNGVSFKMVAIKGGTFEMGSNDGESNEKPVHSVTVSDFYMGETEVTVAQFEAYVKATGYQTDAEKSGGSYFWIDGKWQKKEGTSWRDDASISIRERSEYNHPVIYVSWNDAVNYCEWLKRITGRKYRLPAESEWEYAAGNGTQHTKYSWGDGQPTVAKGGNVEDETMSPDDIGFWSTKFDGYNDGYWFTAPVGLYGTNDFGLQDMTGNVWEWCEDDWHGSYSGAPSDARTWVDSPRDSHRVFRGGSWSYGPPFCRVAFRYNETPDYRSHNLGFRVALAP